jgi:hypothetical protein
MYKLLIIPLIPVFVMLLKAEIEERQRKRQEQREWRDGHSRKSDRK